MLAYYLHNIDPWLIQFREGVGIRWYGVAYVMGFLAAYLLFKQLAKRGYGELKESEVGDYITLAALLGVMLGGRLGFMLFYNFHEFIRAPWMFLEVWKGGMASHGGIIGLVLVTFFYARRRGYDWTGVGDNLVAVAPLGVFFGRIANFINGELYGKPATVPWAMQFPEEMERYEVWARVSARFPEFQYPQQVIAAMSERPEVVEALREILTPRHPSQLYQAGMEGLALFAILFAIRLRWKELPYGILTGLFFIGYATFRILGEVFREPDYVGGLIFGIQKGQFYSFFMYAAGALLIVRGVKRGKPASV